jgi:probable HAF family extracellular repeat protein
MHSLEQTIMKINGNCNGSAGHLVLAAAMSIGLGFGTHALAQHHSSLIDFNIGTPADLGNLKANIINDAGPMAGYSHPPAGGMHAFTTGPHGAGMTDLGTLGGSYAVIDGINAAGQVVGQFDTAGGYSHTFLIGTNGMGMIGPGTGTLGGVSSAGVDAAGRVVGYSFGAGSGFHFHHLPQWPK